MHYIISIKDYKWYQGNMIALLTLSRTGLMWMKCPTKVSNCMGNAYRAAFLYNSIGCVDKAHLQIEQVLLLQPYHVGALINKSVSFHLQGFTMHLNTCWWLEITASRLFQVINKCSSASLLFRSFKDDMKKPWKFSMIFYIFILDTFLSQ